MSETPERIWITNHVWSRIADAPSEAFESDLVHPMEWAPVQTDRHVNEFVRADRYDEAVRQRDDVIAAARRVILWVECLVPDEPGPIDALVKVIGAIDDARSSRSANVKKDPNT